MLHDVTVELGGETRTLRCDLGAWAALEDRGTSLHDVLKALQNGGLSMRHVRDLVVAMLWQDGITPAQVGSWITGANFAPVMERVGEALRGAFPEDTTGPPPSAPSGTGSDSSNSGLTAG